MDYDALAKQFGGSATPAPVDYDALAKQFGGQTSGIPGKRADFMTRLGRGAASLADVVVGDIPAMVVQQAGYPVIRAFTSPERATELTQPVTAALTSPVGKLFGVEQTPEYKQEASRKLMDFIGQNINKGSKWISAQTGLPESDVSNMIGSLTLAAPAAIKPVKQGVTQATKAVVESQPVQTAIAPVKQALQERQTRIAGERSAKSWERAPQIEAAQLAPKYDIALDPAQSNPTVSNRIKATLSGAGDLDVKLSARNEAKWVSAAKDAMGLPAESVLDKAAFDKARSRPEISRPYEAVRNIQTVVVPDATYEALDRLRVQPLYGDTGQAAAANAFIDNLQTQLQQGGNGSKLLKSVQQLRQEAQSIYHSEKAGHPITPEMRAQANAKMGAADALELAIEESIPDTKARQAFADARKKMAQTYDFEAATNFATGKLDPQVLAKMAEEGKPLSGVVGDLAKIAANYPETSKIGAQPELRPRLTRTGVSGTIGGVIGNMLVPGAGWVPGTAIGAGVGYVSSGIGAKRMATPEYQLRHAVPTDYRQPAPFQEIPRSNALVPYNAPIEVLPPEIRPNWVYGQPSPNIQPGVAPQTNMLAPPSAEGTMNRLQAERERAGQMSRVLGEAAEQRGNVVYYRTKSGEMTTTPPNEPADMYTRVFRGTGGPEGRDIFELQPMGPYTPPKKVNRGELMLEIDPVTGRLREASQGIKGATPETFSNFGASLDIAANKVASGQRFALTAAEKVAWDKTKVDLAEVAPGFKALNDKAIAERMQDRAWVEQTAVKAREKAAAFEQIARRAADERARQTALANRERMMTLAEEMEDSLRVGRPTSGGGQGPKTREFNRNRLITGTNKNNLTR